MQEKRKELGNLWKPIWKLCEFQIKRRCTDVDEFGKFVSMPLTGLSAANQFAFFAGTSANFDTKEFNITAHVRTLKDIISLNAAHAQTIDNLFADKPDYLDYLKSEYGADTLMMILVKNRVNAIKNTQPDPSKYDFDDEESKKKFFAEKERCDRYQEDQQVINGTIVASRELTVSTDGYHELDYDTDEVIVDFEDFRDAFTIPMNAGHSEFVAYRELENVTIQGRIETVNDFVTLFTEYVDLHPEDIYFINSLGKELPIYGVYASDDDAKLAEEIDTGVEVFQPNDPKVIRL